MLEEASRLLRRSRRRSIDRHGGRLPPRQWRCCSLARCRGPTPGKNARVMGNQADMRPLSRRSALAEDGHHSGECR
ncbi:hypothetical protein DSL92_00545 [Billgrantia gudaonensis]|uniref:Uncharacterized protein n=1 Tax=Billgrantia gudaonensis TaxID=376427 RepID=A0A432JKY0_9GAMM|nr:hypothetical protein DSL92_00545 [Halomonas gudaonensis]